MLSSVLRRLVHSKIIRNINNLPKYSVSLKKWPNSLTSQTTIVSHQFNYFQPFSSQKNIKRELTPNEFEHICEETLESLCETIEILIESHTKLKNCDVTFGDGVLTISFGDHGTYVINRQTPNKQIWLSSPKSGPKRYDFDINSNIWIYKHDNISLHSLLEKELSLILKDNVDLSKCSYSVCKS